MSRIPRARRCCILPTVLFLASVVSAAPLAPAHRAAGTATAPRATTDEPARWGIAAIEAHLAAARARTLEACTARGLALPVDFLAWIDGDAMVRASVYGCRRDPLPVLLGLRALEIDLGEEIVRRDYTQLALAFALQDSYAARTKRGTGWNDADGGKSPEALPDIAPRPRLVLEIPGDPRVAVDTKDPSRSLDANDHIVNFLEDHAEIEAEIAVKELPPLEYDDKGVAKPQGKAVTVMKTVRRKPVGADVIASSALQREFNEYMASHGHAEIALECGDRAVHWHSKDAVSDKELRARIKAAHELFHDAYRAKGRMPAERDRAPTASESMAWFIRNDRHAFDDATRAAREWPRFPLNAPWPVLLMLAADDQPLREREEIWTKFRDSGEFRTYGEYIGGIAQQFDMQSARRVAPIAFSYGSIQMMWKDGGVCGTMGNIGARTHRIVGQPASTAGQPGHCAIVFMEHDPKTGAFRCKGGQYATGGDEVTTVHAGWNYDDVGGRRPMVFHQSIAWAVNRDFAAFVDTLVLQRAFTALDADTRAREATAFVEASLARNTFALPCVLAALDASRDAREATAVLDSFRAATAALADEKSPARGINGTLYLDTVRDLAHQRVLALPAPATAEAARELLSELERQDCEEPKLLARLWRAIGGEAEFAARTRAAAEAYLASPERTKGKRASEEFARTVKAWADGIKATNGKGGKAAKDARAAWAAELLAVFQGKETLKLRGKPTIDPVVVELSKIAGREPPSVAGAA
jgi:hypothetical protein